MLCFDVLVNGARICRAGVGTSGVLSAIVSWVGKSARSPRKGGRTEPGETRLHVGGLYNPKPSVNVHPSWAEQTLKVGDEVAIKVVEADNPDPAIEEAVRPKELIEREQRRYFLKMRKKFEREQKPRAKRPVRSRVVKRRK